MHGTLARMIRHDRFAVKSDRPNDPWGCPLNVLHGRAASRARRAFL